MAAYDPMGSYTGYDATDYYEEERKRKEEEERKRQEELANTQVSTQKVTTYGDGSKTQTTTTEIPAGTEAVYRPSMEPARAMPIPSQVQPVSPDSFQRIRQIESGNRDYTQEGKPVTSSAGALFASQVMPQTAQNPGFGIKPAQNQTPEEYNRVGQEYFSAMKKRYGGNEELAAAAYHSGPGNVDKALQQAQQTGNDWRTFLGPQGQQYVQKFTGGQQAPQAVAPQPTPSEAPISQAPTQPVSPTQLSQYNPATGTTGMGLKMPGQTEQQPQQPSVQPQQMFQTSQDNVDALIKMRSDENVPEYLRKRAGDRAYELLNQNIQMERAQAKIQQMTQDNDAMAISRVLTSKPKDQEGSWLKFALYGFISPQLAQAEAVKLGIAPTKWEDGTIIGPKGEQIGVQINRRSDGKIIGGTRADGTELSAKELELAQSGLGKNVTTTAETYIDQAGNRYRSQTDEKGNARMVNIATGQRFTGDASKLQRQSDVSSMARADYGLITDLKKKHGTNVLDAEKDYVSLNGPFKNPEERQQFRQAYGFNLAQPAGQTAGAPAMPQQAPQMAPAQTMPAPAAPATPAAPTITQPIAGMKTGEAMSEARQKEFLKYSSEDITPKADAGSQIARIRREQIKGPDGILNNPELAGLLQGTGGKASEVGNIVRDLITGNFKDQADLTQRVAALNLTDRQKEVLYRQIGLNAQINPLTLKANAGPGAISEAEHKINAQANVDITRQPLYSGLSLMTRDQFNKDMSAYRGDFKAAHPELNTTDSFNRAWSAEKSKLEKQYDGIYAARAEYIAKYNKDGKNPGAVIDAYKHYPVPEWNAETRSWDFGTEFAKKAARPKLNEFVR